MMETGVVAEPTFRQVASSLAGFLEGCDLVGFNLRWFDVPILQEEFARAGVKFELAGRSIIDACAIFKMNERRNLAAAYALYCEKDLEGAHSAGADTLATMEILLKQIERYSELPRTAAGLHEYCRDPSWVDDDGKFKWLGSGSPGGQADSSAPIPAGRSPDARVGRTTLRPGRSVWRCSGVGSTCRTASTRRS